MLPSIKKIKLSFLLVAFVFFSLMGSLAWLTPAHAQLVTSDVNSGTQLGLEQADKIKLSIKDKAVMLMMQAVMSGLNYFMNKIAYDSAVYLASGGHGQNPLAHKDGPGGYLKNVAGDALGEALGEISNGTGFNLCDLPDPRLDLALKLSLHLQYSEPKPKCSWQQIKAAYNTDNIKSKYFSKEGALSRIAVSMEVGGSDFGVWLEAKNKIDQHANEAEKAGEIERTEGNGFKAMTDIITGEVKTPAAVIEQEFKSGAPSQQKDSQSSLTAPMLSSAMQKGALSVVYQTAGTFVNTLLGTMLKNFTTKGMLPGGAKLCNPGLSLTGITLEPCTDEESSALSTNYYSSGLTTSNRRLAQEMFNDLLVPKIKTVDNFEVLSNLANCSEDDKNPYSCLVDQAFLQILQSAEAGEPMTIREALEKNYLHGDWKILSAKDSLNAKWNCAEEQVYCYRNIQVLRKLRILPLGLEIAASVMENSEQSLTLKQLVDKFLDVPASENPYYKLVNPNWIIKLPKMRCNAQAPGTIVQNGARYEECVDLQHCVAYNKDGSCSNYGYCLEEEQRWVFGSDYCDWNNDTCTLYTDNETGESVSYLSRTVDNRFCDEDNVGCRKYATLKFLSEESDGEIVSNWATADTMVTLEGFFSTRAINDNNLDDYNPTWVNVGVNLNAKAESCNSSNDGCSAFKLASDTSKTLYIKKAPDYLGCYDSEVLAGDNRYSWPYQSVKIMNGIQWPQTVADLGRIQPQDEEACKKNYAQVCLPEEESCNYYISESTGEKIPGKFNPAELVTNATTGEQEIQWNNQCDQTCLGYDAFRIMPSAYDIGKTVDYIIPSSGQTCSASEVGCTSFTNLSETAGDFEKVEYFSYLRSCIPPDQNKQKTFYSYESTENGDIRLSTFVLEVNPTTGGPKLLYNSPEDYDDNLGKCSLALYSTGTADPNCRRLDDDSGNSYYVMINKTILVSDQCTPYRLNETAMFTEDGSSNVYCPYEYAGPNTRTDSLAVRQNNNACYYYGMPSGSTGGAGETQTCGKEVDSCRAYKGNAGNNYRVAIDSDFENYNNSAELNEDWLGWQTNAPVIELSTESTNSNGHSMKVDPSATRSFMYHDMKLISGKSYNVSFWARGGGVLNSIFLRNNSNTYNGEFLQGSLNVTDVWHYYSFGPVQFDGDDEEEGMLFFELVGNSSSKDVIYLDNIRLTENTDSLYLVRDSLSVDAVCDSNPNDNLPGEALGCRAYKDSTKTNFYLTGFSYLCREDAVGCAGLIDTFNTLDTEEGKYYNIWFSTDNNAYGDVSITVGTKTYSCFVERGEGGCFINTVGNNATEIYGNPSLSFTSSTQYFPPDTPTSSPVYLVVNEGSVCRSENLGCQKVGLVSEDYTGENFTEVMIKNDPALYDSTLCNDKSIGCKSYSANGGTSYFKDPTITGGRLCEWRYDSSYYGWYIQGTTDPCYSDYTLDAPFDNSTRVVRGLLSNGHSEYNGSVGICPADQNGCSEFADPVGSSNSNVFKHCAKTNVRCYVDSDCDEEGDTCVGNNSAQSYFLLDNDALREGIKECNGMVSVHEGCILFDKTSIPNKYWNAYNSYAATGELREPVSNENNDTNIILKVDRDRECSVWAFCSDYQQVDQDTRRCHRLGVCSEAGTSAGTNVAVAACQNVVTEKWSAGGRILDLSLFLSRSVGRTSFNEYSGYAMYNSFQISDYTPRYIPGIYYDPINGTDDKENVLVVSKESADCTSATDESATVSCVSDDNQGEGKCFRGECIMDITGKPLDFRDLTNESSELTCRAYPETTSPFDVSVFNKAIDRDLAGFKKGYEDVNVCSGNKIGENSCDCDYLKYKTAVGDVSISQDQDSNPKFLDYGEDSSDSVISDTCIDDSVKNFKGKYELCSGGKYDGYYCDSSAVDHDCSESDSSGIPKESEDLCSKYGGICSQVKGRSIMSGWKGYCMEDDVRYKINGKNDEYHCLTWWPVESVSNDFWLFDDSAAYQPGDDRDRYMCLASETANAGGNDEFIFDIASPATADQINSSYWGSFNNDNDIAYPKGIGVYNNGFGGAVKISNLPANAMLTPYMGSDVETPSYNWGFNLSNNSVSVFNAFLDRKFDKFLYDYRDSGDFYWDNVDDGSWDHTDAYLRNEIEEVDILLDDDSNMENGDNGYISFTNLYSDKPYNISYSGGDNPNQKVCDINEECCLDGIFCVDYKADISDTVLKKVKVSQGIIDCSDFSGSTMTFGYWQFSMVGNDDSADTEKIPRDYEFDYDDAFVTKLCQQEESSGGIVHYFTSSDARNRARGSGARLLFVPGQDGNLGTDDDVMLASWLTLKDNSSPRIGVISIIHQSGGSCAQYAQVSESSDTDGDLNNFSFKPVTWRLVQDKVRLQNMSGQEGATLDQRIKRGRGFSVVARTRNLDGGSEYGLMNSINPLWTMGGTRFDGPLVNPFVPISLRNWNGSVYERAHADVNDFNSYYSGHDGGVPLISVDSSKIVSWIWAPDSNLGYNLNGDGVIRNKDYNSGYFNFNFSDNNPNYEYDSSPCNPESGSATDTPYCQMLKRMYANVVGGSNRVATFDASNPQNAGNIHLDIYPPHIAAPTGEVSSKIRMDSFSVNGISHGNVVLTGSGDEASIQFYAWADPNQMPLRRLSVLSGMAGDPALVSQEVSIGNHKATCKSEKYCYYGSSRSNTAHWQLGCETDSDCGYYVAGQDSLVTGICLNPKESPNPEGFGNGEDTGCKNEPFEYVISYTCSSGDVDGVASNFLTADEMNFWNISRSTSVCVFTPKVQVLDNWGWCSGTCTASSYTTNGDPRKFTLSTGYGCFDGQSSFTDCGIENIANARSYAWVPFDGQVIVPLR